jgi:hypothetical protein
MSALNVVATILIVVAFATVAYYCAPKSQGE